MSDEEKEEISLRVNKTFNLNRRARLRLWRWTQVAIASLLTAGSVSNYFGIEVTRKNAKQDDAIIKQVVDEKDRDKDKKIEALDNRVRNLVDVWDSHLIWLENEKRFLRSPGSQKRFEDEITRLRLKMKPISQAEPLAGGDGPAASRN